MIRGKYVNVSDKFFLTFITAIFMIGLREMSTNFEHAPSPRAYQIPQRMRSMQKQAG
jgi:hypothetical protein